MPTAREQELQAQLDRTNRRLEESEAFLARLANAIPHHFPQLRISTSGLHQIRCRCSDYDEWNNEDGWENGADAINRWALHLTATVSLEEIHRATPDSQAGSSTGPGATG